MIRVTKFDGTAILLNADWIQTVEETPDTVITLTTGFVLVVRDRAEEIAAAFKEYKRESGFSVTTKEKENEGRS